MANSSIFALLVGINEYAQDSETKVPPLDGCINDIDLMESFLEDRYRKTHDLQIIKLKNKAATYDAVIDYFKRHLGQAKAGDFVLFQFSGHGSRIKAPAEFHEYYPSRFDEALVCYDSRMAGKWELSDKEVAVLLANIDKKAGGEADILVIADACHSGSITRGQGPEILGTARQLRHRDIVRPLESYIDEYYFRQIDGVAGKLEIPSKPHIAFSACQSSETAVEYRINTGPNSKDHGLFTHQLVHFLDKAGGRINYHQLYLQTRPRVKEINPFQSPYFTSSDGFNSFKQFLSREAICSETSYDVNHRGGNWEINRGLMRGFENNMQVSIFKKGDPEALGKGKLEKVLFASSNLLPEKSLQLDTSGTVNYEIKLADPPSETLNILLDGEENSRKALIKFINQDNQYKHVLFWEQNSDTIDFRMTVSERNILFHFENWNKAESIPNNETARSALPSIFNQLYHWHRMKSLVNPLTKISDHNEAQKDQLDKHNRLSSQVDLVFAVREKEGSTQETPFARNSIELLYDDTPIYYSVKATNRSPVSLKVTLMYLDPLKFRVVTAANVVEIPAGKEIELLPSEKFKRVFLNHNSREDIDRFQLVVTTADVDIDSAMFARETPLQKLLMAAQVNTRGGTVGKSKGLMEGDYEMNNLEELWFTRLMSIRTIRKHKKIDSSDSTIGSNLRSKGHRSIKADVVLPAAKAVAFDNDDNGLGSLLKRRGLSLMTIDGQGATARQQLRLKNIQRTGPDEESQPLKMLLNEAIADDELVIPIAMENGTVIPLGFGQTQAENQTLVQFDGIPDLDDGRGPRDRSLGTAFSMVFSKVVFNRNPNALTWAEYDSTGVFRGQHTHDINAKVARAKNILLVLHGIIGDTRPMLEGIYKPLESGALPFGRHFDLILAYDYENLKTDITESAGQLLTSLTDAGINAERPITVLAHSMGGLVARHIIEREPRGKGLVNHLIMAGTPNGGSKLSEAVHYRNFSLWCLGAALQFLPVSIPAAAALAAGLGASTHITNTLAEMKSGSALLNNLGNSTDPNVPYTLIAGSLRLHDDDEQSRPPSQRTRNGIIKRIALKTGHTIYKDEDSDMAVSVESIFAIPEDRNPAPRKIGPLSCHHMSYFDDPEALQALAEAVVVGR